MFGATAVGPVAAADSADAADAAALTITELTPETLTDETTVTIQGTATGFTGDLDGAYLVVESTSWPFSSMDDLYSYLDSGTDFYQTEVARFPVSDLLDGGSASAAANSVTFTLEVEADAFPSLATNVWGPFGLQVELIAGDAAEATVDALTARTILLRYSELEASAAGQVATTQVSVLVYELAGTVDLDTGELTQETSTTLVRDGVAFAVSPSFISGEGLNYQQLERRFELVNADTALVVLPYGNADLGLLTGLTQAFAEDEDQASAAAALLEAALSFRDVQAPATVAMPTADEGASAEAAEAADAQSEQSAAGSNGQGDEADDAADTADDAVGETAGNATEETEWQAAVLTNYAVSSDQWFGSQLFDLGDDLVYLAPSAGLSVNAETTLTPTARLQVDGQGVSNPTGESAFTVVDSWGEAAELLAQTPTGAAAELLNRQLLRSLGALVTLEDLSDTRTLFVNLPVTVQDEGLNDRLQSLLDNPWITPVSLTEVSEESSPSTISRAQITAADASDTALRGFLTELWSSYDSATQVTSLVYEAGMAFEAEQAGQADSEDSSADSAASAGQGDSRDSQSSDSAADSTDGNQDTDQAAASSGSATEADSDNQDANQTGDSATGTQTASTHWSAENQQAALAELTTIALTAANSAATQATIETSLDALTEAAAVVNAEPTTITLINSSANLPFSITNTAGVPLVVTVDLITSDPRLQVSESVTVRLAPESSTNVEIPVTAVGSATLSVKVQVTSANVVLDVSESMTVRVYANWEDTATIVVCVVVALLFIGGMIRTIKRGTRKIPFLSQADRATKADPETPAPLPDAGTESN